ncbi:hypothetical protein LSAT2_009206 [Lamellibrachia satsuma]|nr:hypothetical protein LSAT2_009206 [Lamellibrachia satsuma]
MKLALMLNCINIAEELIENTKLEKENMEELTEMAILDNRFEFVRLFLYSGIIDLQMFLTEKKAPDVFQESKCGSVAH